VITEIGGFVETCLPICSGFIVPAFVEIYRSAQGLPDLENLIASFTLSNDGNPDLVSYESTSPGLLLGPGAYFALFGLEQMGTDSAYVLGTASAPFPYESLTSLVVQVNWDTKELFGPNQGDGAVRVLGVTVPEPSTALLLAVGSFALMASRSRSRC
jgi:hypothetical protein